MQRLTRLFIAAAASLLLLTSFSNASEGRNVIWFYLEDVSGWFSCYGDKVIETPNIDALAKDGTLFNRFYTPAGVCSATRSAIVTGMMQTTIGAHNHRSCRPDFRGKSMGEEWDENILPDDVVPLPKRFMKEGFWTFNDGGKDDYNFTFDLKEFYHKGPYKGWGSQRVIDGTVFEGMKPDQRFFGQIQFGGGKLGKKTPKVVDRSAVPVPPYYPDVAEVREEIAHHYDCLLKTDQQVGEVVAKLKEMGLYENTYIFLFSDHGMKLHRHKQMLYDGGIHMPLIVTGPGVKKGEVRDDLISGIDISAATLAAAGLTIPKTMEGKDFLAKDYQPHEYIVAARDRCDYTIEKIRAVVSPKYKYLRNYLTDRPYMQPTYKDGWPVTKKFRAMMAAGEMNDTQNLFFGPDRVPEEFYDLANDPHEINNLANDPQHATALEQHRKYLAKWIEKTGDKGQAMESDVGLKCTLKRWGNKCVNPEYDRVRDKAE